MLNGNYRNETVSVLCNKNKNFLFIEPIPTMPQKRLFVLEKLKSSKKPQEPEMSEKLLENGMFTLLQSAFGGKITKK